MGYGNNEHVTIRTDYPEIAAQLADIETHYTNYQNRPIVETSVDTSWPGWSATNFYNYGFDKNLTTIPIELDGMTEVKGTLISRADVYYQRRWGYHVFEGWSLNGTDRLTILVDKHPNYAEIYNYYQPPDGVPSNENYKWVKLGSDVADTGFDFSKESAIFHKPVTFNSSLSFKRNVNNDVLEMGGGSVLGAGVRNGSAIKMYGGDFGSLENGKMELYIGDNTKVLPSTYDTAYQFRLMNNGVVTDLARLRGNGNFVLYEGQLIISKPKTPTSATDTGISGNVCWDSSYVYVCVNTNTWKRAALTTW